MDTLTASLWKLKGSFFKHSFSLHSPGFAHMPIGGRDYSMGRLVRWVAAELGVSGKRLLISFLNMMLPDVAIDEQWNTPLPIDMLLDHVDPEISTNLAQVGARHLFGQRDNTWDSGIMDCKQRTSFACSRIARHPLLFENKTHISSVLGLVSSLDWRAVRRQEEYKTATFSYSPSRSVDLMHRSFQLFQAKIPHCATVPAKVYFCSSALSRCCARIRGDHRRGLVKTACSAGQQLS